jgi:ATP-dependent DNA helicase DinG
MARAVEEAFSQPRSRLVVEAPTGTGKSLAYLSAAACGCAPDGERLRVVVATGTKALQDQLVDQDVPLLAKVLREAGLPAPRFEVVKGRRNYLCKRRLSLWQPSLGLDRVTPAQVRAVQTWALKTQVGDRAEVAKLPEDSPLWPELDADADTCLGTRCALHDACFITLLRARAREAHVVITNHHLLCADQRLKWEGVAEGGVLPPWDALVVDEAHRLPGAATEHFGLSVGHARLAALVRDGARVLDAVKAEHPSLQRAVADLERAATDLFTVVAGALGPAADGTRVPFRAADHGPCGEAGRRVLDELESLRVQAESFSAVETALLADCEALARRAARARDELAHLVTGTDEGLAYCADRRGTRGRLMAFPTDVATILRETILADPGAVVFTSATLAMGGDFSAFRRDVGLDDEAAPVELALASPFLASQAVLYVPDDLPVPDAPSFLPAVAERAARLVRLTGGGAFMLCTTTRAVRALWEALTASLPGHRVLRQGEAPKGELLGRFRRDGDAVLVATHSFWEGVDVRGRALRLVMVDKMPFAPPHDPLLAARVRRAEEEGRSGFATVQLPEAVTSLRQGLGRLLRGRDDRGVLAVMDVRLHRKGYGKTVLKALGDHPVVKSWEELERAARGLGVAV